MKFDVYGVTDTGCVRELNEDSYVICGFDGGREPGFCVVADGMGGHNAGEVASSLAVDYITDSLKDILLEGTPADVPRRINDALSGANANIYRISREDVSRSGMGTTAVVCAFSDGEGFIANIGDSRAYACRSDEIYQITVDHSIVEELVECGTITKEEARKHPRKNIITRAVGSDKTTKADIFEYEYRSGDTIIMCSDGLSGMVEDDVILNAVKNSGTSRETAETLIEIAKENGGLDNITVIVIRILEEDVTL